MSAQLKDFECTCGNGKSGVGKPAVCETGGMDECVSQPCGAGQECTDPDTRGSSTKDFVCRCTTGKGTETGKAAVCKVDECASQPCGKGQECTDPDETQGGDFECTCRAPQQGTGKGKAAVCELDECVGDPCGTGQTCADPDTKKTGDFTCTCANGAKATGGSATCEVDECA
eukprot:Sspe_Gene.9880::Locus_3320_Transcript_2_2_Confidence_1.000_Length_584::g.9880::m.9880